jgi:hypothetical protein
VDLVAAAGQDRHRDRADAAARPEHEHGTGPRLEARALERVDRERRGEAGGPDRHRVAGAHPVRQRDDPLRRNAGAFGEAAVVGDAEVVAVREHRVPDRHVAGGGRHDAPGEVDPGHERRDARDLAVRRHGQRVLVVHRRPLDGDRHFARRQVLVAQRAQLAADLVAVALGDVRGEAVHAGQRVTFARGGRGRHAAPPRSM